MTTEAVACPEPPTCPTCEAAPARIDAEPEPTPTTEPVPAPSPEEPTRPKATRRPPKPTLTLPRMPGTNQLRAGTKWDETREAWALTFAYEIPATRPQVGTFYRKVLLDAGMEVTRSEGAPDEEGAVPLYLKGRVSGQHAHVTVRQSVDQLETRVRVIWRFYEGGSP